MCEIQCRSCQLEALQVTAAAKSQNGELLQDDKCLAAFKAATGKRLQQQQDVQVSKSQHSRRKGQASADKGEGYCRSVIWCDHGTSPDPQSQQLRV